MVVTSAFVLSLESSDVISVEKKERKKNPSEKSYILKEMYEKRGKK